MNSPKYSPGIAPCAVCEERFVGCHATCDAYKAWKEKNYERYDIKSKIQQRENIVTGYSVTNIRKMNKKTGKGK